MLNALILSDRTIEYHTFPGVFCRAAERILADPDCFDRNQDAFGIETMQNVGKALALLADPIRIRNEKAIDENRIGVDRLAAHLRDSMDIDLRSIEIGVKDRDAIRR